jgi:hypothetical protein
VNVMIKKILILWMMLQGAAYAEVSIPDEIKVPASYKAVLTAHAEGDQIYQCSVNKDQYAWQILAPDAKLFDEMGTIVGNHTAGPLWEYKEGSRVVGKVVKKIDIAPGSAISWLLVEVVSHQGNGLFSNVGFINRINTRGGLAPKSRCDANHLGREQRVAYTADYVFYGK